MEGQDILSLVGAINPALLKHVSERLAQIADLIDDERFVPCRFSGTEQDSLAESDSEDIRRAAKVINRLFLWRTFTTLKNGYFTFEESQCEK